MFAGRVFAWEDAACLCAPTPSSNLTAPLCAANAASGSLAQDPVPGAVRPTVGASSDEASNAWEPERDYVMVGDWPLSQVRRVQVLPGGHPRCSWLRCVFL